MIIIKKQSLPTTNNSWGFGGVRKKFKYTMENGDTWISGIAGTRHLGEFPFIKLIRNKQLILDKKLTGKPENFIYNHYIYHEKEGT